jgi:hypothetical protein
MDVDPDIIVISDDEPPMNRPGNVADEILELSDSDSDVLMDPIPIPPDPNPPRKTLIPWAGTYKAEDWIFPSANAQFDPISRAPEGSMAASSPHFVSFYVPFLLNF